MLLASGLSLLPHVVGFAPSQREVNQVCRVKNTYMMGTILICFRKFQPEQFKVKTYAIENR